MARLTVAPHGFGRPSLRSEKHELTSDLRKELTLDTHISDPEITQTEITNPPVDENINDKSQCMQKCEDQKKQLMAENDRLSATVSQLHESIKGYEMEIDALRKENKHLQESKSVVHASPNDFETRLTEIEQAVAHGLTHTLNALQGIRSSQLTQTQDQVRFENLLDYSSQNPSTQLSRGKLAITAGPGTESSIGKPQELTQDPSTKELVYIKHENMDGYGETNGRKYTKNGGEEVKVKMEDAGVNLPYKYNHQSSKGVTEEGRTDDFEEITFFQKPSTLKPRKTAGVNDKLRRVFRVKPEPDLVQVKPEPIKSTETSSSKMRVKREYFDENSHSKVKEENTKRRKALTPVIRNNNTRTSSAGNSAKKLELNHAFDFVDKSTLLEQSRASWKKSSS